MQAPAEFQEWLRKNMSERDWGIREMARQAKVSPPTITDIATFGKQPSFDTCLALARAFGVPPVEVLVRAGLLPPPSGWTPDREEWGALFDALSDDDRENLLDLARIMRTRKRRINEERGAGRAKPKKEPASRVG